MENLVKHLGRTNQLSKAKTATDLPEKLSNILRFGFLLIDIEYRENRLGRLYNSQEVLDNKPIDIHSQELDSELT